MATRTGDSAATDGSAAASNVGRHQELSNRCSRRLTDEKAVDPALLRIDPMGKPGLEKFMGRVQALGAPIVGIPVLEKIP